MEVYKIFIASSIRDFRYERYLLKCHILSWNDTYKSNRIEIQLEPLLYGDNIYPTPLEPVEHQSVIDKIIPDCRYFFALIGEGLGESTEREITAAYKALSSTTREDRNFFVYKKETSERKRVTSETLKRSQRAKKSRKMKKSRIFSNIERRRKFDEKFQRQWGQRYTPFDNVDEIKRHMDLLFEELGERHFNAETKRILEKIRQTRENLHESGEERDTLYDHIIPLWKSHPEKIKDLFQPVEEIIGYLRADGYTRQAKSLAEWLLENTQTEESLQNDRATFLKAKCLMDEGQYSDAHELLLSIEYGIHRREHISTVQWERLWADTKEGLGYCLLNLNRPAEALSYLKPARRFFSGRDQSHYKRINAAICRCVQLKDEDRQPPSDSSVPHADVKKTDEETSAEERHNVQESASGAPDFVLQTRKWKDPTPDWDEMEKKADEYADKALKYYEQWEKLEFRNDGDFLYYKQSLSLYKRAFPLYRKLIRLDKNRYGMGYVVVCNNFANLHYMRDRYFTALRWYRKAWRVYEAIHVDEKEIRSGIEYNMKLLYQERPWMEFFPFL